LRKFLAWATYPVFLILNRPSMTWFGNLVYDFALRCNCSALGFWDTVLKPTPPWQVVEAVGGGTQPD